MSSSAALLFLIRHLRRGFAARIAMSATDRAKTLRTLIGMLNDASEVVIKEWEAEERGPINTTPEQTRLASPAMFEARRIISGACGMFLDITQEPTTRLTEVANSFFLSRALHIAAKAKIADVLSNVDENEGLLVDIIAMKVGINAQKLTRVLRTLCTIHIFREVKPYHFAHSPTSRVMIDNEYLRCWLLLHAMEIYSATDKLFDLLFDPVKTNSYNPRESAWQEATGDNLLPYEYLEQHVERPDGSVGPRPQLDIWSHAMVGVGRASAAAMYADYPWEALGCGTLVDVGGGVGGTCLDLSRKFPNLRLVVQDRLETIRKAETIWMHEYPEAIQTGRVRLVAHDFFAPQPIRDADVYFLRYVLHDWPDDECVAILAHLREAMKPDSMVLVADHVIHPTAGSAYLKSAPSPLPPNYGSAHQFENTHDLAMMATHNAMERTPEMLEAVAVRAGLHVIKIWECRGGIGVTELRRDVA
ncbi:S-adenosyl-L-methionine-dependent methyltransferase [Daedalea quercina L-15889]|uniref:S-adenosyl-L-methionine-dependent methyltransferase n=1 Tax=Daedalea quercina L-15889 TaxID=1314783 RepID=A0A165U1W2_9APHY|nr:S-adenosyl-L-methionine-dependent methyltransferase [Daedalea quercina L-15889]